MTLEELREAATLLKEIEPQVDKFIRMLELLKEIGLDKQGVIIPPATERFVGRNEVCRILKVGGNTVQTLISNGQLTPLYVAGSNATKFRLSEVLNIPKSRKEKK